MPKKQEMKTIYKYFIFGLGLGIHASLLHKKLKAKKYLLIEPSLEIFRLSLFVTDYEYISKDSDVHFAVALDENEFHKYISMLSDETFLYDQYIKFFMFSQNCDLYVKVIQNFLVSQRHILYSYDRSLESFQRTYAYMSKEFNYLNLTNIELCDKPTLLLAAGPSLEKDINFVKKNRNKFIIVALYVLLPYLEEEDIIPDIITQYDQQEKVVMSTLEKVKNKNLFDNCIFIFASHLVEELMLSFPKSNIFIFQALYKVKNDYKMLTAPSIGEITYALLFYLGVKKLYLLGLDMALSEEGNSHVGSHVSNFNENNSKIEKISFRSTKLKVRGNFRDKVTTLPLFKISIDSMNNTSKFMQLKDIEVYNLSDGAFFEGTLPLQASNLNTKSFERIDKKKLGNNLKCKLLEVSSNKLSPSDIEYNLSKLKDANLLDKTINLFYNTKYNNITSFKKAIFVLFDDLIYKDCTCYDLQDILLNFYKHNLPYIFHFCNIRGLSNEKKYIIEINQLLRNQTNKIFNEYKEAFIGLDLKNEKDI